MQSPYFDLLKSSGDLQASTMERSRELWRSYYTDLQRLAAEAQIKARELWQSHQQELRAAGAGDDFAERVATAQSNFQRAYAELEENYIRTSRSREQSLADSLAALNVEYGQRIMDGMIRYFEAVRKCLPEAPRKESDSNRKS